MGSDQITKSLVLAINYLNYLGDVQYSAGKLEKRAFIKYGVDYGVNSWYR